MTDDDIINLQHLLHRMRAADPEFRVFDSDNHRYLLGEPLAESGLQAFEQTYQVTLPADYRFFLQNAGNGGAVISSAGVPVIQAGAGPGYGLQRLDRTVLNYAPGKPFPFSSSTADQPVKGSETWGKEKPYPGVLKISHQGCAFFSYLVVNGPAYGTVWEADLDMMNFYPLGLSFEVWYRRWINRLINRALPMLANEHVIAHVDVGMTKEQVVSLVGGQWKQRKFGAKHTFLHCENLATDFEMDENDVIVRAIRHSIL